MGSSLNKWILIIGGFIVLATIIFAVVTGLRANALRKDLDKALLSNTGISSAIAVEANKNVSLSKAIHSLYTENERLIEVIDALESKPETIRYIVKTETKLVAQEPIKTFPTPPDHYQFILEPGLIVAEINKQEEDWSFVTHSLDFKTTLVIDEKNTGALLEVASSADGIWHQVPTDLQVYNTETHYPNIKPNLHLGFSSSSSYLFPQPVATVPFIHLTEDLDILIPGIVIGKHPEASLYLGSYNLGSNLPLINDLWVGAGLSTGIDLQPAFTAAVTTNL